MGWVGSCCWGSRDEESSLVSCSAPAHPVQPVFLVPFVMGVPYPGAYMCAGVKAAVPLKSLQNIRVIGTYLQSMVGNHKDPGVFQVLSRALCSKGRDHRTVGDFCGPSHSIPLLKQGHPKLVSQGRVQTAFEQLQGWRLEIGVLL